MDRADYDEALIERENRLYYEPRCMGDCWECDSHPLSGEEIAVIWRDEYLEWVDSENGGENENS